MRKDKEFTRNMYIFLQGEDGRDGEPGRRGLPGPVVSHVGY